MRLLELPADIIALLGEYFSSIYDLYSVILTCRTLHAAYRHLDLRLPPILPKRCGHRLFQPHPRLLLTAVARQLGDWACSNVDTRCELYESLVYGWDGLLSLAERVTRVSLTDLQKLNDVKYNVFKPVTRVVDFDIGPAMVRYQNLDPEEYGLPICEHPKLAILNFVVYCELFSLYVDDILDNIVTSPNSLRPYPLDESTRYQFIVYCLPSSSDDRNRDHERLGAEGRGGGNQRLDYLEMSACLTIARRDDALSHFWRTDILQETPDTATLEPRIFDPGWVPTVDEKREILFVQVVAHLGWISLDLLLLDGFTRHRKLIEDIKKRIKSIPARRIKGWEFSSNRKDINSILVQTQQQEPLDWDSWPGLSYDCDIAGGLGQSPDEELEVEAKAFRKQTQSSFESYLARQKSAAASKHKNELDSGSATFSQDLIRTRKGLIQRRGFDRDFE